MKMEKNVRAAAIVLADPILYWNDVALEANRVSHTNGAGEQTGPTLSSRALAIVHLAMYDAYIGVTNAAGTTTLPPYLAGLPIPSATSSADAAVAAAAHATLTALFPSQKAFFDLRYAEAGLGGAGFIAGHAFGLAVARSMLADRSGDPGAGDAGYASPDARCHHRPDPDNPSQGFHAPFYGAQSKCFAVTERHALDEPPCVGDEYEAALREVRAKGIAPDLMGTLPAGTKPRSAEEGLIGIYWGYDGAKGLGTPPRLYNQIIREVAKARGNSAVENARLFALANVAMADAGILAWEQKYLHDFWRPVVGIREDDQSMGPSGSGNHEISANCDPAWLPLGAPKTNGDAGKGDKNFTPPFPAYPSGHATFGAAAFQITRLFYGVTTPGPDDLFDGLDFISEECNGINRDVKGTVRPRHVRNFPDGLWQMMEENGRSRVFLGVHWLFDAFAVDDAGEPDLSRNIGGVVLGMNIAEDIFAAGSGQGPRKSSV